MERAGFRRFPESSRHNQVLHLPDTSLWSPRNGRVHMREHGPPVSLGRSMPVRGQNARVSDAVPRAGSRRSTCRCPAVARTRCHPFHRRWNTRNYRRGTRQCPDPVIHFKQHDFDALRIKRRVVIEDVRFGDRLIQIVIVRRSDASK